MNALRILSDEHQALAGVLHAIRFMLTKIAAGTLEPDRALFQAMVHYLDAYAEQHHHPKEERLFAVLKARTAEGAGALATLSAEHAAGPERIATLQRALADFTADPRTLGAFTAAFEQYADFYRTHMMLEEDTVLPLARHALTPADWAAVDAFFAEAAADTGGEDFTALFDRLVECAPDPIGLGARLYAETR